MRVEDINKIQGAIESKWGSKGLHVLNGMGMLQFFKEKQLMQENFTYIPFNEAMC